MSPFFGKKKEKEEDQIFQNIPITAKDIVAPSSLTTLKSDHLVLGKRLVKSFFIFSYPRFLNTDWFSPIINMVKIKVNLARSNIIKIFF